MAVTWSENYDATMTVKQKIVELEPNNVRPVSFIAVGSCNGFDLKS